MDRVFLLIIIAALAILLSAFVLLLHAALTAARLTRSLKCFHPLKGDATAEFFPERIRGPVSLSMERFDLMFSMETRLGTLCCPLSHQKKKDNP